MATTLPPVLPGESAAQYAQRIGMSPNDLSRYIAYVTQSNSGQDIPASVTDYIARRNTPQTAANMAAFGGINMNDPASPYYNPPYQLGPQIPIGQNWVGNTPPANSSAGPGSGGLVTPRTAPDRLEKDRATGVL